jgi:hypothetical protein
MTSARGPLRVLTVMPFGNDAVWHALSRDVRAFQSSAAVEIEQLVPATENALRKRLQEGEWHALHFVGQITSRGSAHYDTLTFESSTGTPRGMTIVYLTSLLAQHARSMRVAVIAAPTASTTLASQFYARIAAGRTIAEASKDPMPGIVVLPLHGLDTPIPEPVAAPPPPTTAPDVTVDPLEERRRVARRELERKRAAAEFDVFLCHNASDKPHVREIAARLEERGILPWLDERELRPGEPWQPLLEQQIGSIKSAAVFVGANGVGPWQEQEIYGFLREFVARKSPVIPVLLPDAPAQPALPIFLRAMTWVDFRVQEPEPLARLIWGITGQRPE